MSQDHQVAATEDKAAGQGIIIGLAGFRRAGKSKIAEHLIEKHGFRSVHPFGIWKRALVTFYTEVGVSPEDAEAMVDGHLKDAACENLPNAATSRYLMEELGNFTGTHLGSAWTIGLAIEKIQREEPDARLVIESIVYEVDVVQSLGGHVIMVDRPGQDGMGHKTDAQTKLIVPDSRFLNDGNDLDLMKIEFDAHLSLHGLIHAEHDEMQPG